MLFVPRGDVEVQDDWHVMGLRGTGSKSVIISEPIFVPAHRLLDLYRADEGPAYSRVGRASYALPVSVAIAYVGSSVYVGTAQGVVDEFTAELRHKRDSFVGTRKADQVSMLIRLGQSAADAYVALSEMRGGVADLLTRAVAGQPLDPVERTTYQLSHVHCVELARRAATRLFEVSGTSGMLPSSSLLRRFGDLHAGSKHLSVRWDDHAESYGRTRFGMDSPLAIH
jgi:alkylation response protein AidB-like acyl-CoA dehydrogenase